MVVENNCQNLKLDEEECLKMTKEEMLFVQNEMIGPVWIPLLWSEIDRKFCWVGISNCSFPHLLKPIIIIQTMKIWLLEQARLLEPLNQLESI